MTQRMPTPVCLLLLMIVVLLQPVPGVAAQNNRSAEMLRAIPVPNLASDLWRAVRQRDGLILPARSQQQGPESTIIINPYGEQFRQLRVNKIIPRLLYVLPVVMVLILLFFLIRGRLRLQDGFSGDKIPRFKTYERLLHWLMAISFLVLACTGIVLIFGRKILRAITEIGEINNLEYSKDFKTLNVDEKKDVIQLFKKKSKRHFNEIVFKVITYYYTNEKVLSVISSQSVPPFPKGNFVKEGDLLLFEDVFLKGNIWRKCPST